MGVIHSGGAIHPDGRNIWIFEVSFFRGFFAQMLCPYGPRTAPVWSRKSGFRSPFTVSVTLMNSLNIVTLKAFLSALAKMPHPLTAELQNQLNQIDIATQAGKLHNLAKKDETLNAAYKVTRQQLQSQESVRAKGPMIDDSDGDRNDNPEIPNASRVSTPLREENLPEIAQEVVQSEDSVKAMQEIYDKIKYCLC